MQGLGSRKGIARSGNKQSNRKEHIMATKEELKMMVEAASIFRELQDHPKVNDNGYAKDILQKAEVECYRAEKDQKAKFAPKSTRKPRPVTKPTTEVRDG
jgi:hypothetical protein